MMTVFLLKFENNKKIKTKKNKTNDQKFQNSKKFTAPKKSKLLH